MAVLSEAPAAPASIAEPPLVVDLDGTLLRSDSLVESLLALAHARPWALLALPAWLLQGRARLKQALAAASQVDVATLPFDARLVEQLRHEQRRGRRLVLATAADRGLAQAVAAELGLFDQVLASDGTTNLAGAHKRDALVRRFGLHGFDYVGDSRRDLPVWAAARCAWVVGPTPRLEQAARAVARIDRIVPRPRPGPAAWLRAMRLHHWPKNLLLLVPLVAANRLYEPRLLAAVLAGALAFCLAASGVYLLNDLLDLGTDRRHPHKRRRALASGLLPLAGALALLPLLWLAAGLLALAVGHAFAAALGIYVATMIVYSLGLKDVAIVDALVLAGGYTLRIGAGALAAGIGVSPWLMVSSVALFFGLALLKRYAELVTLRPGLAPGGRVRAYRVADAALVSGTGVAAGCVAVALLATYPLVEPTGAPRATVWPLAALLLLWTGRMWLMAHRGAIHDDPVAFALRDRPSRALGLLTAALLLLSR